MGEVPTPLAGCFSLGGGLQVVENQIAGRSEALKAEVGYGEPVSIYLRP